MASEISKVPSILHAKQPMAGGDMGMGMGAGGAAQAFANIPTELQQMAEQLDPGTLQALVASLDENTQQELGAALDPQAQGSLSYETQMRLMSAAQRALAFQNTVRQQQMMGMAQGGGQAMGPFGPEPTRGTADPSMLYGGAGVSPQAGVSPSPAQAPGVGAASMLGMEPGQPAPGPQSQGPLGRFTNWVRNQYEQGGGMPGMLNAMQRAAIGTQNPQLLMKMDMQREQMKADAANRQEAREYRQWARESTIKDRERRSLESDVDSLLNALHGLNDQLSVQEFYDEFGPDLESREEYTRARRWFNERKTRVTQSRNFEKYLGDVAMGKNRDKDLSPDYTSLGDEAKERFRVATQHRDMMDAARKEMNDAKLAAQKDLAESRRRMAEQKKGELTEIEKQILDDYDMEIGRIGREMARLEADARSTAGQGDVFGQVAEFERRSADLRDALVRLQRDKANQLTRIARARGQGVDALSATGPGGEFTTQGGAPAGADSPLVPRGSQDQTEDEALLKALDEAFGED